MRGTLTYFVGAVLLALVGGAFLLDGMLERRMAIAQEDFAALDFVDPENEYAELQPYVEYGAKIPWVSEGPLKEMRVRRAALRYWQADYETLAGMNSVRAEAEGQVDPELQFVVANAMYRTIQAGPQDKATILKALDSAIRAYGEVLRATTGHRDAAFNYEFVVRLRDEIAGGRRKAVPGAGAQRDGQLGPLLRNNLHGLPGAPPIEVKQQDFMIRIPVDSREIDNEKNQAAGLGRIRKRRG